VIQFQTKLPTTIDNNRNGSIIGFARKAIWGRQLNSMSNRLLADSVNIIQTVRQRAESPKVLAPPTQKRIYTGDNHLHISITSLPGSPSSLAFSPRSSRPCLDEEEQIYELPPITPDNSALVSVIGGKMKLNWQGWQGSRNNLWEKRRRIDC
jgi:hypothetical protein